jgi:hypothetical protein
LDPEQEDCKHVQDVNETKTQDEKKGQAAHTLGEAIGFLSKGVGNQNKGPAQANNEAEQWPVGRRAICLFVCSW